MNGRFAPFADVTGLPCQVRLPRRADIEAVSQQVGFGPAAAPGFVTSGQQTLASHGITAVEHDDDSQHRPGINDLRYVIQNNSDALSAGVPKFFMSVARQNRHQA
jgi:hypothetical protein